MRREYSANELRELKIRRNRVRRQRQLRRRMVASVAALIIIVFSSFGLTTFLSRAQETPEKAMVKHYTSVMMPYGSSLSELSEEYIDVNYYKSINEYINEVMFINHISDAENIQAGEYLIMPYYAEIF